MESTGATAGRHTRNGSSVSAPNEHLTRERTRRSAAPAKAAESDGAQQEAATATTPLLVHIGFHKTGSTWLQQHVFGSDDLGFQSIIDAPRHRLVEHFVRPDPLFYDAVRMAAHYEPYREKANGLGKTLVLSHERLSGYPASGGHDRTEIARRLHATFPGARILMVLREQKALISSMYGQYVADGGAVSLASFLRVPEPGLGRMPYFSLRLYEFDRLIEHYFGLFGRENVLALPAEMLGTDPQGFVRHIQTFCGQPTRPLGPVGRSNERRPALMQLVQRRLNTFFSDNELSPGALIHIPRFQKRFGRLRHAFEAMSPGWLERRLLQRQRALIEECVGDYYAESNRRSSELLGIDLSAFKYPVGR